MIPSLILGAVVAFVVLCIGSDLRTRRIPNLLSGSFMLLGAALNTLYFGGHGLLASVGGVVVIIALLLPAFALGGLGGGDVKMMGAIGALVGPSAALPALLLGMAFGGAIMAAHLARLGRLRHTLSTVGTMAAASVLGGSLKPLRVSASQPGAVTLPYSVPLGLGTIVAVAMSWRIGL